MTTVPSQKRERSRHYQAWSAPNCVPDDMLAVAVDSSSKHALSRRRQAEKYLQNCSGAPRASSSQQSTCSALQLAKAMGQPGNPE